VIHGSHARKPVVVGWSLGGVAISNYLAKYGDRAIAGAVYVDGVVELARLVLHARQCNADLIPDQMPEPIGVLVNLTSAQPRSLNLIQPAAASAASWSAGGV